MDEQRLRAQLPPSLTLRRVDGRLSLCRLEGEPLCHHVDFLSGRLRHRSAQHLHGEKLVRACRIKGRAPLRVLDATAGTAQDAYLLHRAGFEVLACERNAVLFALLQDGLCRLNEAVGALDGFRVVWADANELLPKTACDVVYLDPMFPARQKSALVKKPMQLLHTLLAQDTEPADGLLECALQNPFAARVVVKRPRLAPPLAGREPGWQLQGKTTRFDVYQK